MGARQIVAVGLARVAARLVAGHDDRVVLLNTRCLRGRPGKGAPGRVLPFIVTADDPKMALGFSPDEAPDIGTPVPARVARLAGYSIEYVA